MMNKQGFIPAVIILKDITFKINKLYLKKKGAHGNIYKKGFSFVKEKNLLCSQIQICMLSHQKYVSSFDKQKL